LQTIRLPLSKAGLLNCRWTGEAIVSRMDRATLVEQLDLKPHPEGGFYRETWRSHATTPDGRALASGIVFLLPGGVVSRWHRIDGEELWIHQAGSPLTLRIVEHGVAITHTLGLEAAPQVLVPPHAWQDAESDGDWTLVSCVVSPGFDFKAFEMAPVGWSPREEAP
jgi:hypothetical protein